MKPKKDLNMKRLFRRNQVIITALAVMIAAAGYLNYAGKQELEAGSQVYEAGMLEISDEDILAENQASDYYGETLAEIGSLDQDILEDEVAEATMAEEAQLADAGEGTQTGEEASDGEMCIRDRSLVWGNKALDTGDVRTVDVHVRRLREKIEPSPSDPKYVHTKWGVGYYFRVK